MRQPTACLASVWIIALAATTRAQLELPAVISDHMVLQRESAVPIWGKAGLGQEVTLKADWLQRPIETSADALGVWNLLLETPAAGGPHRLAITAGEQTVTVDDILFGEVWICSGQSNMEMPLDAISGGYYGVRNYREELAAAKHPRLRLFDVPHALGLTPQDRGAGSWAACTPQSARTFSAAGYFFGRELLEKLDVPIGLIGCNWGGTRCEAWTSEEALRRLPACSSALERLHRLQAAAGAAARDRASARQAWWQRLAALDEGSGAPGWWRGDFPAREWASMDLPAAWAGSELKSFDGVVWFRKELALPSAWRGRDLVLELGPIDDMDTTWFNSVKAGATEEPGHWQEPRRYRIPARAVRAGRNVVAVRVLDTGGEGGFCGRPDQMRIHPKGAAATEAISLAGPWRWHRGVAAGALPPWPGQSELNANTPTALFNGMIAPLLPFAIRGAIWYQGESNRLEAALYRKLFPAMIADWRGHWGRGVFPFYFVQIAPFAYRGDSGQAAELREAQRLALTRSPSTGMAVTMDIGNPRNIHPDDKQSVGHRLALWALARTYGREGLVYSGPLYRSMRVEGGAVRLLFDHTAAGLVARGGELKHFEIAGADGRFHPARARIDGASVVVSCPAVSAPRVVRYGWKADAQPNLFNSAGLPASSFRTDSH